MATDSSAWTNLTVKQDNSTITLTRTQCYCLIPCCLSISYVYFDSYIVNASDQWRVHIVDQNGSPKSNLSGFNIAFLGYVNNNITSDLTTS